MALLDLLLVNIFITSPYHPGGILAIRIKKRI